MNRFLLDRIAFCLSLSLVIACQADGDGSDAPCAQTLQAILRYDCDHSLLCRAPLGQTMISGADEDACIKTNNERVGRATAAERAKFLTDYGRCYQLGRCDYTTCVGTGAHGFGELQANSVAYNCMQSRICSAASGLEVCETDQGLADCISVTTGQLDSLSVPQKQAFVDASARCASLTGCTYVDCMHQ